MERIHLSVVVRDYDFVARLACGDISLPDIHLHLRRLHNAHAHFSDDQTVDVGEYPLAHYLLGLAAGDSRYVGLPFVLTRSFGHRCFFTRKDAGLKDFTDLRGARVGMGEWASTNNIWCKGLLRNSGLALDDLQWWVGQVNRGSGHDRTELVPKTVHIAPEGITLLDMLLQGDLEAIVHAVPPADISGPDSEIVRLYPNYKDAEKAYYGRTHIYPGIHFLVMRRESFERHPQAALVICNAFQASRRQWEANRRRYAETTPWMRAEFEEIDALAPSDRRPGAVELDRGMFKMLSDEMLAQGLIERALDPSTFFSDFEAVESLHSPQAR